MKRDEGVKLIGAKVPTSLLKKLDKAAKTSGRTRSSELRMRLEHSLKVLATLGPAT